jgi:KAP family P-loop domain
MTSPLPELVLDDPSASDQIEGRAHERLADTIATLIQSHEGGRAIGLEGSWGGGKSTVIEMLASRLRKSAGAGAKHSVLIFDAWAHNDDPTRRVFLEELIDQLRKDGAIDKEHWDEELAKYREESKTIKKNIRGNMTFLAKVLILVLPVYAAAGVFLDLFKAIGPIKIPLPFGFLPITMAPWFCVLSLLALPYVVLILMYVGFGQLGGSVKYDKWDSGVGPASIIQSLEAAAS